MIPEFDIKEWISGDIDIESRYYLLMSYLQKSFNEGQHNSIPVIKDLKNKMIDLYCENINYSENKLKKRLINIGQTTIVQVYDSIIKKNNQNIIKELDEQIHW